MFKKIVFLILVLIFSSVFGLSFFIWQAIKIPFNPESPLVTFKVQNKQRALEIAKSLQLNGLISSWWVFAFYSKLTGQSSKIKAGTYQLAASQNMKDILAILVSGKVSEFQITIPEGWSNAQIAQYLEKYNIIKAANFLANAKDLEGYLFPDTYKIKAESTTSDIISKMKQNFETKTRGLGLTKERLILASIIEREAKFDVDRAKIASVYLNRLSLDMPLEADPTVQYAKGSWDKISKTDLEIDSPYNTYKHKGLPPGPICNPGLKSIQAAINPESTDYLYFFHLKEGTTIYSKTKEEHNQKKKEYQGEISN